MGWWDLKGFHEISMPRPQRLQTEVLRAACTAEERMTRIHSCRRAPPKRACLPNQVETRGLNSDRHGDGPGGGGSVRFARVETKRATVLFGPNRQVAGSVSAGHPIG
jgi:hypothetical protein